MPYRRGKVHADYHYSLLEESRLLDRAGIQVPYQLHSLEMSQSSVPNSAAQAQRDRPCLSVEEPYVPYNGRG
jgi:hypothetical protein